MNVSAGSISLNFHQREGGAAAEGQASAFDTYNQDNGTILERARNSRKRPTTAPRKRADHRDISPS